MAKVNPGLVKLKKINAKAKTIRAAAGSKTTNVKVVKYNMKQTEAIKKAARIIHAEETKARVVVRASAKPRTKKAKSKNKQLSLFR